MFIKVEINHYGYIHSMRNEEPEVLETICSVSNKITYLHVIDTKYSLHTGLQGNYAL
jgi:hypothetical protein